MAEAGAADRPAIATYAGDLLLGGGLSLLVFVPLSLSGVEIVNVEPSAGHLLVRLMGAPEVAQWVEPTVEPPREHERGLLLPARAEHALREVDDLGPAVCRELLNLGHLPK